MSTFPVDQLDVDRLLFDWRWLCPQPVSVIARNAFGELFLTDDRNRVLWLNVTTGALTKIADSPDEFRKLAMTPGKREAWFSESAALAYSQRGMEPSPLQCIAFSVPAVFAEGGTPDTAYVADIYEHISFLGDLHRQISSLPDGSKITLKVLPPKL